MERSYYNSPIGILEIVCKNDALVSLRPVEKFEELDSTSDCINKVKSQLDEYFAGKRIKFDLKLALQGTDFQKQVWNVLQKISYGETKSYSDIATYIGNKNSQRAVGMACNKNPIMIIIPCHRVISKSGKLSGYAYGVEIKEKLLNIENKFKTQKC